MTDRLRTACRLIAVLLVIAVVALPPPASAHATLIASTPQQDQHLASLPRQVSFEFNKDMSPPAYVIVTAPDGSAVTDGDPVVDGPVVSQALADGPDGAYTMAYRAVSADGHPVAGEITFTVGSAGAAASPSNASSSPTGPTGPATGATAESGASFLSRHVVAIVGAVALFGSALVLFLLSRRSSS